ncbi:MAG: DUF4870 domain-containing protein [Candidatus Micrarchaeia archaeon]
MDRRSVRIAVLAHASMLFGFFFRYSFLFPLLIWKTVKHTKYSEFQAKQAAYYQIFSLLLLLLISFSAELIMLLPSPNGRAQKVDEVLVKSIEFVVYSLLSLYALYGAYKCSRGEEFRYILLGDRCL